MIMILLLVIIGWLTCSFLGYGLNLGYFTFNYPDAKHFKDSLILTFSGPAYVLGMLLFLYIDDSPIRFRIKPLTTEQRFQKFNEKYEILGIEYFEEHYR